MTLTVSAAALQNGEQDLGILLDHIVPIACEAGEIVTRHRQAIVNEGRGIAHKKDGSIVTLADKESSAYIVSKLHEITPEVVVMSEENQTWPNTDQPYWAIDPLDGTKIFADGGTGFSIDIALILHGEPVLGVTCCPAHNTVYFTAKDLPSYKKTEGKETEIIQTKKIANPNNLSVIFNGDHADIHIYQQTRKKLSEKFNLHLPKHPINEHPMPLNLMVAEGFVDAHIKTGRDPTLSGSGGYVWDNASTHLILKNAGGEITDLFTGKAGLQYPERGRERMHGYIAFGDRNLAQSIFANRHH